MSPLELKPYLVTGGAGFIGANFIYRALEERPDWRIINLDALTYSGNPGSLADLTPECAVRHRLIKGDVRDPELLQRLFRENGFCGVIHFAAESHVDRSILGPDRFLETNVMGTFRLLDAAREFWAAEGRPKDFRFLHISTDEVYGSLGPDGLFTEQTAYDPSSPYSASKAGSDHLVKAYFRTYGLPAVVTNCSNNYGPYQFPEKLIPLMILNILDEKPLPVYGDGKNVRDWLYVRDHCDALLAALDKGVPGETYNIGGNEERRNIDIIHLLCEIVDARLNRSGAGASRRLIRFVPDRPGHDRRYAIDASKARKELGWQPRHAFEEALSSTVDWYLDRMDWVDAVRTGEYRKWIEDNYGGRS